MNQAEIIALGKAEGAASSDIHLLLRSPSELCTSCGRRREQIPDKDAPSEPTYYPKGTYLDEDGLKHRAIHLISFPLKDAPWQLCPNCHQRQQRLLREEACSKRHKLSCIFARLTKPEARPLSHNISLYGANGSRKGAMI